VGADGINRKMMLDPDTLLADFAISAKRAAVDGWPCALRADVLRAPHSPPALPPAYGACTHSRSAQRLVNRHLAAQEQS
jgi:hypothetical protein